MGRYSACPRFHVRDFLFRLVPAFDSLRGYSLRDLSSDTMAGLTVAAVAVPQAMAYAQIAGMPPQYGLYTAIVMTAVGALLDSSQAADQRADQRDLDRRAQRLGRIRRSRTDSGGDSAGAAGRARSKPASRCCGWAISHATSRTP